MIGSFLSDQQKATCRRPDGKYESDCGKPRWRSGNC